MTAIMTVISLCSASFTSRYKIFLSTHLTVLLISNSLLGSNLIGSPTELNASRLYASFSFNVKILIIVIIVIIALS